MSQELEEFKQWMKTHARKFRKGYNGEPYNSREICELALAVGYSKETIQQIMPEAFQDVQACSTYKLREDYHIKRELDYIIDKSGKPLLDEQWHHLMHYENGQEEWH